MVLGILSFCNLFRRGFYLAHRPDNSPVEFAVPDRHAPGGLFSVSTLDRLWPALRTGGAHGADCGCRVAPARPVGVLPIASEKKKMAPAGGVERGGVPRRGESVDVPQLPGFSSSHSL